MVTREAPVCLVGYFYPPFGRNKRRQQQKETGTSDNDPRLISTREGEDAARQIGAIRYIEWTNGPGELYAAQETLMWYGYYYHLSKVASQWTS
jgi:hypothetical protein